MHGREASHVQWCGRTINCRNATSITEAVKWMQSLGRGLALVSLFYAGTVNAATITTSGRSILTPTAASTVTTSYSARTFTTTSEVVANDNMTDSSLLLSSSANPMTTTEEPPGNEMTDSVPLQVFFAILYAFIFVVGIAGNFLVCYVVFRNKAMQTVTNYFITNLALSDILLCILAVPFTPLYTFIGRWVFGPPLCHIVPYAQGCSVYISTLTLTAVAIDRFFVIVYPFQPRMKLSVCIGIIASIWCFALLVTLPYGLYMKIIEDDGMNFCEEDWPEPTDLKIIFSISTTLLQFAIPFLVITFCYVCVSIKLNDRARAKPGSKTSKREEADRERKKRTNRMLIAMVAVFGISWMPLNMYNILADFRVEGSMLVFFVTHAVAMSSTCYNPFLYAWLNENFRKEFLQILPCLFRALSPLTGGSSSSGPGQNTASTRTTSRSLRRCLGPTSTYDPERLNDNHQQAKGATGGGGGGGAAAAGVTLGAASTNSCGNSVGEESEQRLLGGGSPKIHHNNNHHNKNENNNNNFSGNSELNNCDMECQRQELNELKKKKKQQKEASVSSSSSSVLGGLCHKVAGNVLSKRQRDHQQSPRSDCLSVTAHQSHHIPLVVDPISIGTSSSSTTGVAASPTSTSIVSGHQPQQPGKAATVCQLSPQHTSVDTAIVTTTHSKVNGGTGGVGGGENCAAILETHFEETPLTTTTGDGVTRTGSLPPLV